MSGGIKAPHQLSEAEWASSMLAVPCGDEALDALAFNLACAMSRARPKVSLPPHNFRPWKSVDYVFEGRIIVPDTAGVSSVSAATVGSADGVSVADAATGALVVSQAFPKTGYFGIVYEVGYWPVDVFGQADLTFSVGVNSRRVQLPQAALGVAGGELRKPHAVLIPVRHGETLSIKVDNASATSWHMAEAYFRAYLIEANFPDESLDGLDGATQCLKPGDRR